MRGKHGTPVLEIALGIVLAVPMLANLQRVPVVGLRLLLGLMGLGAVTLMWAVRSARVPGHGGESPYGTTRQRAVSPAAQANGVPVKEAAEILGHTPAMLLSTYAHVLPGATARAVETLAGAIAAGEGASA